MFYSHEILTSRKYGVATVWLVATLGAKSSSTKKLSRKAIQEVNVKKACATIMEPEAPMALRLQSNLLYGVSRVYDQQCTYILQDTQTVQNAIRSSIKSNRDKQLDEAAGKARPEQLMLLDDPAFMPEVPLPAFDFDFEIPNFGAARSTQSMMSIWERGGSVSSSHVASVLGLNIPSSSGNSQYQLPRLDPFGNSPVPKAYGGLGLEEEEDFINNDDLFGFNKDGQLMEGNEAEREQLRAGAVSVSHRPSDSAASGRVRKEHEDGRGMPIITCNDDFVMNYEDDDLGILADDAEPFGGLPVMTGGLGGNDQPQRHSSRDRVFSEEELSSDTAQAPQVKMRKPKPKKLLALDKELEIRSSAMKAWQTDYLTNMAAATLVKEHLKANAQAKKNAFHFILGGGLNRVGGGIGSNKIPSPLDMFAGESLLALVTGQSQIPPTAPKSTKRKADKDIFSEPKRARESEQGRGSPSQHHPIDDDGGFLNMDDGDLSQSVELGRDAASALPDYTSSAMMPWNKSASLHSHNRNLSSQYGRGTQLGSGIGGHHRLASASPLIGRGSTIPGDLDELIPHGDNESPMYGREDGDFGSVGLDFGGGGAGVSSSQGMGGPRSRSQVSRSQAEEFELFGRAANVDTQTAGTSQWVRDALDKESNNFFEYVRITIEEKADGEVVEKIGRGNRKRCVTFEELFNVEGNSHVVAAQAFYHVLCLTTKGRVWVEQDDAQEMLPFGEIRIGVC